MKWIRWDGRSWHTTDRVPVSSCFVWVAHTEECISCEKHDDWREIESGTLNLEDGKWHITLKPLPEPEKVPTLLEAAKAHMDLQWNFSKRGLSRFRQIHTGHPAAQTALALAEAIDREEKKSPNPYTKEAVDEALDALLKAPVGEGFNERECPYTIEGNAAAWKKFQALLRQREAANVT